MPAADQTTHRLPGLLPILTTDNLTFLKPECYQLSLSNDTGSPVSEQLLCLSFVSMLTLCIIKIKHKWPVKTQQLLVNIISVHMTLTLTVCDVTYFLSAPFYCLN